MTNYANFEIEDFLMDESFTEWVKTPNEASNEFWSNWITNHPEQKTTIETAAAAFKIFTSQEVILPETFYSDLKQKIDTSIAESLPIKKTATIRRFAPWMKVAAILIGIIGIGSFLFIYLQSDSLISVTTAYKEVKTFELPDHSMVTLNANSTLEYLKNWDNNKREVTLSGEGFFTIKHSAGKEESAKFIVHANDVSVEVYGTEFNVQNRDSMTEVMLQTGKVQLQIKGNDAGYMMKPGDFIAFNTTTKGVIQKTVNPSYYTAWLNHKYSFSKVTLQEVCNELQAFYGLRFQITTPALAAQEISGTLVLQDETSLLQTLSSFLNADISRQGKQVTISSK